MTDNHGEGNVWSTPQKKQDLRIWCWVWMKPYISWQWQTVFIAMIMHWREKMVISWDLEVVDQRMKEMFGTTRKKQVEEERVMVGLRREDGLCWLMWSVSVFDLLLTQENDLRSTRAAVHVRMWLGSSRNWSSFLEWLPYHGITLDGFGSLPMQPVGCTPWWPTDASVGGSQIAAGLRWIWPTWYIGDTNRIKNWYLSEAGSCSGQIWQRSHIHHWSNYVHFLDYQQITVVPLNLWSQFLIPNEYKYTYFLCINEIDPNIKSTNHIKKIFLLLDVSLKSYLSLSVYIKMEYTSNYFDIRTFQTYCQMPTAQYFRIISPP